MAGTETEPKSCNETGLNGCGNDNDLCPPPPKIRGFRFKGVHIVAFIGLANQI